MTNILSFGAKNDYLALGHVSPISTFKELKKPIKIKSFTLNGHSPAEEQPIHHVVWRRGNLSVVTLRGGSEDREFRDNFKKNTKFSIVRYGIQLNQPFLILHLHCLNECSVTWSSFLEEVPPDENTKTLEEEVRGKCELRGLLNFTCIKYEVINYSTHLLK